MKASNFLNKLAKDAGVDLENPELKALLSSPELSEVEIPDEITSAITGQLMTVTSAKNNPDIAKHFKGQYLQTVNRDLDGFLKDSGLSVEKIAEINQEPDTLKRLRGGLSEYKAHVLATNKPTGDPEATAKIKELTDAINTLQADKANDATEWQNKLDKKNSEFEVERINAIIQSKLGGYNFADSYPADDVRILIDSKIKALPYNLKRAEGKIEVYQKENPDMKAFKDNEAVEFDGIIDEMVAPYLKKAPAPGDKKPEQFKTNPQKNSKFTYGGHQQLPVS